MKNASVGEIQKNFAQVLRDIKAGEEITVTKRGKPVAKIMALGPQEEIEWPDFYADAIKLKGKPVSSIVLESRKDRL